MHNHLLEELQAVPLASLAKFGDLHEAGQRETCVRAERQLFALPLPLRASAHARTTGEENFEALVLGRRKE